MGGGGGGAAGRFCANEVNAIKVRQSVSSVFISAVEVEFPSSICFEPLFIPDGRIKSPAKLFSFFDWRFQISMKVAYLIRIISA